MNRKDIMFSSLVKNDPTLNEKGLQKNTKDNQFFSFSFFDDAGEEYMLPYEPMISVSGNNTIIKREVAKKHSSIEGSIKETWGRGDYSITITGELLGTKNKGGVSQCFPRKDFEKLAAIMTSQKRIRVNCEPLQLLGINYIVIESFDFPFTTGENSQTYTIQASSDFNYDLLLEINE